MNYLTVRNRISAILPRGPNLGQAVEMICINQGTYVFIHLLTWINIRCHVSPTPGGQSPISTDNGVTLYDHFYFVHTYFTLTISSVVSVSSTDSMANIVFLLSPFPNFCILT